MLALAVPFAASFCFVAISAFQQRNVQHARYGSMFAMSILRAFAEATVIIAYVSQGGVHVPTILAIGTGGGLGCVVAVKLSKRIFHD